MNETLDNQYRPSTVTPPGVTLADLLEERGIRQAELAVRMGVTPKFVNELIAGKASVSPTTALALERALDVPADFWLARDARYQEAKARLEANVELLSEASWLDELPLREMCRFGWIQEQDDKAGYVGECLKFFGVASVQAWRIQYVRRTLSSAAYRMSHSTRLAHGALAAWLRQGELQAASVECRPFNRTTFSDAVDAARPLTREDDPGAFIPKLGKIFADCGIAVAFVRAPRGCPVSGAVRWLNPRKGLIQLSFRYMRNDSLWFTFFHECGHIYLHGKKMMFLEDGRISNAEEDEANRFAADKLIPPTEWEQFREQAHTEASIRMFAVRIGIHPGIVLGRLHNERLVPWNRLVGLKVHYRWTDTE